MKEEIVINIGGGMKAHPSEIIMLKSESNYTKLFFNNNPCKIVALTLGKLESRLAPFDFIRTHKSYLINIAHLADEQPDNAHVIRMSNDLEAFISRRKMTELRREFGC